MAGTAQTQDIATLDNPVEVVERLRQLDPDAISARLERIAAECRALLTLLRGCKAARRINPDPAVAEVRS